MSDCPYKLCTKTYQCLACEKGERIVKRAERTVRTSSPRPVAVCGTRSGYKRHLKLGEPTCEPCREAQKIGTQRWQRQNPIEWQAIAAKARKTHRAKAAS